MRKGLGELAEVLAVFGDLRAIQGAEGQGVQGGYVITRDWRLPPGKLGGGCAGVRDGNDGVRADLAGVEGEDL